MDMQYAKLSSSFFILRNYWITVVDMTPYLMDNTTVSYGRFLILLNLMCVRTKGFFLSGTELSLNKVKSVNSGNLIKHWSVNRAKFKHPVSHILVSYTRGGRFEPFCQWHVFLSLNSVKMFRKSTNVYYWKEFEMGKCYIHVQSGFSRKWFW